jgi:hypothetical protein
MNIENIRQAVSSRPFIPFKIHLADGRTLAVQSPEFIYLFPFGRMILVVEPSGQWHHIDTLLATGLEYAQMPHMSGPHTSEEPSPSPVS